ncbi:hypothetical protein MJM99_29910, partial [Salmonella enterica subsp. enterica serovar Kentucky]|nr:hypothetical protein [Salmonella enterica subsp. enterica serovar Kentucky]
DLWFAQQPWSGPDRQEVTNRVIARAITLIEETRPLLPGVREAVFTPFKNAWLKRLKEDIPPCVPAPKIRVSGALSTPLTPVSLN